MDDIGKILARLDNFSLTKAQQMSLMGKEASLLGLIAMWEMFRKECMPEGLSDEQIKQILFQDVLNDVQDVNSTLN